MKNLLASIICMALACSATFADVITFDGAGITLGSTLAPGSIGTETIGSNTWTVSSDFGNVKAINLLTESAGFSPGIGFTSNSVGLYGPTGTASVASIALSGGGKFLFNSLDLEGAVAGGGVATISGLLGGGSVFSEMFNFAKGAMVSAFSAFSASEIDELEINLVGTNTIYFGVDNINVTALAPPAAVPEPSSFAILMLGGAGFWLKRRRQVA